MRWRAGFGNCDDASAADDPGQRNRGCRALMRRADLRQRPVTYQKTVVAAERGVRHHGNLVLRAPWQNVTLNATVLEAVSDLIGCAAIAVRNTEQLFHLALVEVGYTPGANLSRRT